MISGQIQTWTTWVAPDSSNYCLCLDDLIKLYTLSVCEDYLEFFTLEDENFLYFADNFWQLWAVICVWWVTLCLLPNQAINGNGMRLTTSALIAQNTAWYWIYNDMEIVLFYYFTSVTAGSCSGLISLPPQMWSQQDLKKLMNPESLLFCLILGHTHFLSKMWPRNIPLFFFCFFKHVHCSCTASALFL